MKCPKCNIDNFDDNKFCINCGTALMEISATLTSPPPEKEEEPKKSTLDFEPGQYFGKRYRIIEEIGRGGMGRVYKALDKELNRILALKMIKPELSSKPGIVKRFKTEIKLSSQITHKNVCRIHDLGEAEGIKFISMHYVEGQDAHDFIKQAGKLSPEKAATITMQICEALQAAHNEGVIHRDLKPKNIMLDKKGNVYVMDFGIARSIKAEEITRPGAIIGTPHYMSPEQGEGKSADSRSDIYSLGCIMYEMLTGKPPFIANTSAALIHKHITEKPIPPSKFNLQIPKELEKIIMKCLAKEPEKRFQSSEEIIKAINETEPELISQAKPVKVGWKQIIPIVALFLAVIAIGSYFYLRSRKTLTPVAQAKVKNKIAILPFRDLSQKKDQEYFCNGMTCDVITKIRRLIPELKVISERQVMKYKDSDKDSKEIGKELGVDFILEPSFQKENNRIRVQTQLVNAADAFVIWTHTYNSEFEKSLAVQDNISKNIASALRVELMPNNLKTLKSRDPKYVDAYDYYLRGTYTLEKKYDISYQEEDFETAVSMFKKAIEIDPNYALAYWGLGNTYASHYVKMRNEEDRNLALKYREKSYKLDPNLAEANLAMGWAYFYKSDNDTAYKHFKKALEIDPDNWMVNTYAGSFFSSIGLYKIAIECFSRSIEIDPSNIYFYRMLARCFMNIGEYDKAALYIEKGLEKEPNDVQLKLIHVMYLIWLKKYDKAEKVLTRIENIEPDLTSIKRYRALLYAAKGEKDKALPLIKDASLHKYAVTSAYSLLGMKDEAIKYIMVGINEGFEHELLYLYSYPYLINNPCYDNLRDDSRFKEIVKKEKKKYQDKLKKYGH